MKARMLWKVASDMMIDDFPLMRWVVKYEKLVKHNLGSSNTPGAMVDLTPLSPFDMGRSSNKGQQSTLDAILRLYPPGLDAVTAGGASEANLLSFHALIDHGSVVAVESPTYAPLRSVPRSLGCEVVDLRRDPERGWALDLESLERLAPRLDMLVLTNFHNPSCAVLSNGDRKAVLELSRRHGFTVLVDEIYRMMAPDRVATMAGAPNVVVTCSLTKSAGISAARAGWVVAVPETVDRILSAKRIGSAATSAIGEAILEMTLAQYPRQVLAARPVYDRRMAKLAEFIESRPEISWTRPPHGVVAFPRFDIPIPTLALAERMLEKHGVLIIPGEFFEWPGYMRIGVGMCEPDEALALLGRELDAISGGRASR